MTEDEVQQFIYMQGEHRLFNNDLQIAESEDVARMTEVQSILIESLT